MRISNRAFPFLSMNFQVTTVTSFFRGFFTTMHSWITSICEISSRAANLPRAAKAPEPLIIFILGPPGAGKGTQSNLLKAAFPSLTHLSYGDLLRQEDRIPGSWVSSLPRRNGGTKPLVPAIAAAQLLRRTIDVGVRRGQLTWLVDGFPRSEAHVEAWVAQMPAAQHALYLSCPRDTLVQRVLGRAATSGRPDDAVTGVVQERIGRSLREREALLSALAKHGMRATEIDATQSVADVERGVRAAYRGAVNTWKLEQGL
ncbi:P-loop containing nucleoside triphosphate hydrolase protein [Nemania serpens]|nr:P-loop containing nucleoside triphosphate hydrolase protein [Nemania serpens]